MAEHSGENLSDHPDELGLSSSTTDILRKINEIDQSGGSARTLEVKKYLEQILTDAGEIPPSRLGYLEKMVNRVYYDWHAENTSAQSPTARSDQLPKKERQLESCRPLTIYFGQGYHGPGHITFYPKGTHHWQTSEIGTGYTAHANDHSNWLNQKISLQEKLDERRERIGFTDIIEETYNGTVFGIPVTVMITFRNHENGDVTSYDLTFNDDNSERRFFNQLSSLKKQFGDSKFIEYIKRESPRFDSYRSLIEWYEAFIGKPITRLTPQRLESLKMSFGLSYREISSAYGQVMSRYHSQANQWPLKPAIIGQKLANFWDDVSDALKAALKK